MKIINISDFQSFDELYNKYEQNKDTDNELKNLLLLFEASEDPQTKQCWCSDCKINKPIIMQTIEKFKFNDQLSLAIVQVGQRDEWKSSNNPYRKHKIQVTAVPTLISLKNVSLIECHDV